MMCNALNRSCWLIPFEDSFAWTQSTLGAGVLHRRTNRIDSQSYAPLSPQISTHQTIASHVFAPFTFVTSGLTIVMIDITYRIWPIIIDEFRIINVTSNLTIVVLDVTQPGGTGNCSRPERCQAPVRAHAPPEANSPLAKSAALTFAVISLGNAAEPHAARTGLMNPPHPLICNTTHIPVTCGAE